MLSESSILRHLARQPKQAAGYKQLVRELGVRGEERQRLSEMLAGMVARHQLLADAEKFSLPQATASRNQLMGRLSMHRDGYGFVIPDRGQAEGRFQGDVFINPHAIGNAMHGDRVLVELGAIRDQGRAVGRILRVVGRAHSTVVGTFHYGRRYNYVVPIDERITQDVIIPQGEEVPSSAMDANGAKETRHRVLGEEAKKRLREWNDLEGLVVDCEITEWPSPTQSPKGRVIEVLGYEDDFGVDVEIIIRKHHIPHIFPGEVLDEAQRIPDIIGSKELKYRRDYRSLPIVTIDGETARDFDDAVYVRQRESGNYELQVHIADVAHYVTPESALDEEARLRGTSVYFPDRAVPMLPVELSTDICSLRPHLDRLVMSCTMEIDHQGEIVGYEINPGVIRSAARMTYTDVNAILEGDQLLRRKYAALVANFELMKELALILNRKRQKRGAIDFDMPEPEIEFDEFGLMKAITRSERNFAHRLIEEFMLSANECVASYLEQKNVPSLYRIHEKPDPRKVMEFENVAAGFGYSLGVGVMAIKKFSYTDDRRPRRREGSRAGRGGQRQREFEIPEEIHITPRMYQKLTQKIAGTPEERILSYLMLRSLKQARYSEQNEGHFALAAPTYTHFTSPIRRYPDLIVHRILKEVLRENAEQPVSETSGRISAGTGLRPVRVGQRSYHAPGEVPTGRGVPASSETPSPWSKRAEEVRADGSDRSASPVRPGDGRRRKGKAARTVATPAEAVGPIPETVLHEIAEETSQSERRADDAERELMEWKKVKFMADRVGEDFDALIISVTK
ncbi:MAG TPA: RNB domain-containing ribonuclease, partial [Terriglobales bacterium]|nr:RNB domain-containing ribonuclease [Terriglobales bacterium]